jgi:xanthine dehydrogenase accessory factor
MTEKRLKDLIVLIKGGGEMASGVVQRLVRSGFRVCITEIHGPLAMRREVSFCEAIFEGRKEVEGLVGKRVPGKEGILRAWQEGEVPVIIDPECAI